MRRTVLKSFFALFCLLVAMNGAAHNAIAKDDVNLKELAENNTRFALEMYGQLKGEEGNLFFSPYSISTALAMTRAGARGETASQMNRALYFSPENPEIHPTFASLAKRLKQTQDRNGLTLHIANSLWPQKDYTFREEYRDTLEDYYETTVYPVDYKQETEAARKAINTWVEDKTEEKIKDLLAPGTVDPLTRLVLVNAIYFKADWDRPFDEEQTEDAPFFVSDAESIDVPMMHQRDRFPYAETEDMQVLEMPYAGGDISMLVLLPKEKGSLEQVEKMLIEQPERLDGWTRKLSRREIEVYFPRFNIEWGAKSLVEELQSLGITDAFDPAKADFSGMDGTQDLFISNVVQKALVEVTEEGTEAAAATGVVVGAVSATPVFRADHPFLFLIRENTTGSLLFIGRMSRPGAND